MAKKPAAKIKVAAPKKALGVKPSVKVTTSVVVPAEKPKLTTAPQKQDKPAKPKKGEKPPATREEMMRQRSALLETTLKQAQAEYGDKSIAAAGDVGNLAVGIRIPFAMQYVLQNNIWPLQRMVQLVGVEKSNKSSLAFEVVRWFLESMGMGYLLENETKYSPDFAESIIGYSDELGYEVLGHYPCSTSEDWQRKLTFTLKTLKKRMTLGDKELGIKPVGRTLPVLLILDSLAGALTEENVAKIEKRGFSERAHPAEALINTSFLKKFRADLAGWPFSFLVINHLKKQKAENGQHIERKKPGGKHVSFQETFELEMSRVQALKYVDDREGAKSMDIRGNRIKIDLKRSSLGDEDRSLTVDILWQYDRSPVTGNLRQYTRWQWEAAVVSLLTGLEGSRKSKAREIVDITASSSTEFYSKKLGVSKANPISAAEIGKILHQDEAIMADLADLFAIKQRTIFNPGQDFRKVMSERAQVVKKLISAD